MKSSEEFVESLMKLKPNVYVDGKKVERTQSGLKGALNNIALTYRLAQESEYKELLTAQSPISGRRVNRLLHICQTNDDLFQKLKMMRILARFCNGCVIGRCPGCDALNALYTFTYALDKAEGTDYHRRFINYVKYVHEEDLALACAMTDVKGDRGKRPSEQEPGLYLKIVETRSDGIVVSGVKGPITGAAVVHELVVLPSRAMREGERDWAVAFAVSADAEGVKIVPRPVRPIERTKYKSHGSEVGFADSLVVFDKVFVPWDRVFMFGEYKHTPRLIELFSSYHRHSATGCKPGLLDIMMGAAYLAAQYNNLLDVPHIRAKILDLATIAESIYAAGVAAAVNCTKTEAGACVPDAVYANVGRKVAGLQFLDAFRSLLDVVGGLPVALPSEESWLNDDLRPHLEKSVRRREDVGVEQVYKLFLLLNDFTFSECACRYLYSATHGGGSPATWDLALWARYDFRERVELVKRLAGID